MAGKSLLLGVDLGGTKVEAALLDQKGRVIERKRTATPIDDYPGLLTQVCNLCTDLENSAGLTTALALGICTPGSPSPVTGLMRNCNSTALNGQSLREDLEKHSRRPVRIANDADCLVLSEATDGAARSARSVFGVILGTGVGGGFFINGSLLQGPNAVSGEWGHNRMPLERVQALPDQLAYPRPCYCGRQDCVETWLSGPGLALTHQQLHGTCIDMQQIRSQQLDVKHQKTLSIYQSMLAAALAGIINIVDPEIIVLGGGLSNIDLIYSSMPKLLQRQIFSDTCRTQIRAAQHGDSSGVRGAAWLWQRG
ncbi:N-acetyl-D-glucosamine kinase [gamma proteobacterium NOR5-3]|nr:N-acetyl-D-glucosamine kinase [gamma proteobacterium NOR5-3]